TRFSRDWSSDVCSSDLANAAQTNTVTGTGATYTLANGTPDAGSGGGYSWTAFENITDATGTVDFAVSGSVTGDVTADVLDYSGYGSAVTFDLANGAGASTGIGGTWSGVTAVTGSGNSDTLFGANVVNTWNITGNNSGNVNGTFTFSAIENLAGGNTTDNFVFGDTFTISGTVDGNGGTDTLNWSAYATATNVTLTALGGTDGFAGTGAGTAFMDIDTVVGAVGQANTLTGINAGAMWSITGSDDGSYTSTNTLTFTDFANLTGGSNSDGFILSGVGNISGTISDGGGNDTLTGANAANTWNITGNNAGDVDGVNAFAGIENLTGGTDDDTFIFSAGSSLSGLIDGGAHNIAGDSVDYSALGAITVTIGTGITNIENLTGAASATLAGGTIWVITGANFGTVDLFNFSGFGNIAGTTGADSFTVNAGGSLSGTITGNAGSDTLQGAQIINITLTGSDATGFSGSNASINGGFDGIDVIIGAGTGTLTGSNTASTWVLDGTPTYD